MSDEFTKLEALWKGQPTSPPPADLDGVKRKAGRFVWTVRARNAAEWLACAYVVYAFVDIARDGSWLRRISAVSIALAAIYVAYRLYRDGRVRRLPDPAQDTQGYMSAYRERLLEQARLLRNVPRWYLAPFVPGMVGILVDVAWRHPDRWPVVLTVLAACVAVFASIFWFNRVAAGKLTARAGEIPKAN